MHHWATSGLVATALASTSQEFHIAPMQCYTNQPLRKLAGILSPSSIKWTEMEKVDDLLPDTKESLEKRLHGEQNDAQLVLQLGSNDVDKLDTCVRAATQSFPHLKEINLNCGCPAIDTGGAPTYGAKLMTNRDLTARLVESMATATNIDVSVKCRIAVFDTEGDLQALNEKDYQYLTKYISAIHDAGGSHVILHARPAILSMSPVKNRIIPTLNYDFVNQIATDFQGKVKITLNGGINSLEQLSVLQSDESKSIYSHMAGRWCLRRPLDLIAIEQTIGNNVAVDPCKGIDSYIDYAMANQSRFPMSELCLPLFLVAEQLREDYDKEEDDLLSWEDMENLHETIQHGLQQMGGGKTSNSNFKKLFKSLVGTKVVNKWKRNRSEL